jgi:hypothetical protein
MGSYKRVFDPLDLEIIDLVYEAALAQIAARDPLPDPIKELERQEAVPNQRLRAHSQGPPANNRPSQKLERSPHNRWVRNSCLRTHVSGRTFPKS